MTEPRATAGRGHLREAIAILSKVLTVSPSNADARYELALAHTTHGGILKTAGDRGWVLEYRAALALTEALVESDPNRAAWRREAARLREQLGVATR